MDRYHVRQALRGARLSSFEESSLVTGILLLAAGTVVAIVCDDPGGPAWALGELGSPGIAIGGTVLAALSVPPALLFGWVSRLSVLQTSRAREFAADAAAATLRKSVV